MDYTKSIQFADQVITGLKEASHLQERILLLEDKLQVAHVAAITLLQFYQRGNATPCQLMHARERVISLVNLIRKLRLDLDRPVSELVNVEGE